LIAQLATLHAPDEVKLVFFGDPQQEDQWSFVKALPHIFDVGKQFRFLATTASEAAELSLRLERELNARKSESGTELAGDYGSYYVIIVANPALAKTTDILDSVNALRSNRGFSVLTFAEELRELPKECTSIINLEGVEGVIYDPKDSSGKRTAFTSDISLDSVVAQRFAERLASVELDDISADSAMPSSLGFLEMFEVGKVEHLNVRNRWAESNPTRSLAVPLGIDPLGQLSILDAHEDAHGPHGLFAGMTGSGKSETIITYILSLSVNFRPDEVAFVLIDYKGGGLAGAFDNPRARLPHLSGTITNLDGAAIARSLISIQSELKRRQAMFNQARDMTSAGTMDIYKYQELYRKGVVDEACPHLFIIADEFAELKAQQPEFMDQLISAARIGRSLGVHLLLATQKPSGVVNDQIWSNARFKVCLKVADAADSREMLRRPDAAEITAAGRYYLQVGYNEYFALGQSAYSGSTYRPSEHYEKKTDDSVVLVSMTGRPIASVAPPKQQLQDTKTPEAVAVLDHLVQIAANENLSAPRLWLDPISVDLTFNELFNSFPEAMQNDDPFALAPLVGQYDDPFTQSQHLLRLPLSEEGNALIYGAAGSGKSTLLTAMLYSLIRDHPPESLNAYILDFGAETLGAFRSAPQIGDIVFTGDEEKVVNLLRLLAAEIEERRKKLASFGGSLELYNKAANSLSERLPFIVVAINNYDIFPELYERYLDDLHKLTRDGTRYGIYFVLTCTRSGSLNYRMLPNFKQKLAMKLNTSDEYISIFGSLRDIVIPDAYARGLIKRERVFEFQTALLNADEEVSEFEAITATVSQLGLSSDGARAKAIPSLPESVTAQLLSSYGVSRTAVPVGISKDKFTLATQNFRRAPIFMITGDDEEKQVLFAEPFIDVLGKIENARVTVLDADFMVAPSQLTMHDGLTILQEASAINAFIKEFFAEPAAGVEDAGATASTAEGAGAGAGADADASTSASTAEGAGAAEAASIAASTAEGEAADSQASDQLPELDKHDDYLVIISMRGFMDGLDNVARPLIDNFMRSGGYRDIGGLVVSGDPSRFSSFNYEGWYREFTSFSNGVWMSGGISAQSTLKVTRSLQEFRDQIADSFAWFIDRGNPVLIKHAKS
ncbi:MAG: type VII secretion protein EssC, partial [Coriobacteriales bacterium]|nr:type VII secretion protein EssC [Coriobacteriales bacterium]